MVGLLTNGRISISRLLARLLTNGQWWATDWAFDKWTNSNGLWLEAVGWTMDISGLPVTVAEKERR